MNVDLFDGFETRSIVTETSKLHVRVGGSGKPLLLLHGYPQTHHVWARVAPLLSPHHRLIIPDLPGYGESTGPTPDPENRNYSKRSMAATIAEMMSALGYGDQAQYAVAAHDRGARVGFRLALDKQDSVTAFISLDTVPTLDVWEAMDWRDALEAYHWPFLAIDDGTPEAMISANPDLYVSHLLKRWAGDFNALDPRAVAAYLASFQNPAVVAATCADYRAGATIDVADDETDRTAGRRFACPVQMLWGDQGVAPVSPSPIEVWQRWANQVEGRSLPCGHFVAEEQAEACAREILGFLSRV